MTKILGKGNTLLVVVLLALGMGLMAMLPATAHAIETKQAAGTTFNTAFNLALTTGGTTAKKAGDGMEKGDFVITSRNLATFNSDNDNHYYKFSTSNRNSTYRITVKKESDDGRGMNVEIRDSKLRRFNYDTNDAADRTYRVMFSAAEGEIKRNTTYYIELSRYIPESTIDDAAIDRSPYVDYRISVQEIVPKPAAISANDFSFRLKTKSKQITYNINKRSFYADGYQVQQWIPRKKKWDGFSFAGTTYTISNDSVREAIALGSKNWGYQAKIRPYRLVNGKKVYGSWTRVYSKNKYGPYVKCVRSFDSDDGTYYAKGKYYAYSKVKASATDDEIKRNFKKNKAGCVKYARAKKVKVVNS